MFYFNTRPHCRWQPIAFFAIVAVVIVAVILTFTYGCAHIPTGPLPARPTGAKVTLGEREFSANDTVLITVADADQNLDPTFIDEVSVVASVWRGEDREILTLRETGADSGVFTSVISTSFDPSKPNDGRLRLRPGEVIDVSYVDPADDKDRAHDQAILKGGGFDFVVDPELKPSQPHVDGAPDRPVVAVLNPGGWRDEFVANEIVVKTDDADVLDEIVGRWNGRLLHDGRLKPPHPSTPIHRVRQRTQDGRWALVRVDLARADLTDIRQRITAQGLAGKFVFSSLDALRLAAIVLDERERQHVVTVNSIAQNARCPCATTRERTSGGIVDDAFDYSHFDSLCIPDDPDPVYGDYTWDRSASVSSIAASSQTQTGQARCCPPGARFTASSAPAPSTQPAPPVTAITTPAIISEEAFRYGPPMASGRWGRPTIIWSRPTPLPHMIAKPG